MEAEVSVSRNKGCETAHRRRPKDELQDYVLNEIGFLKNATPDEISDNFKLAQFMNRQLVLSQTSHMRA
jgi:hypothetical protein